MKKLDKQILQIANSLEDELTSIRRDFHQHPELGFKEKRTARKIAEYLNSLEGIAVETEVGGTGVVGMLECSDTSPTIALRADIDALKMEEQNDIPYKSHNKGVMHSCGHDGHAAILMGTASTLSKLSDKLPVNVKFIFQPAEEAALGGAKAMITDNVLKKNNVAAIYGFHLNATAPFGKIGITEGVVMAGSVSFSISVKGKGGHSAYPEKCIDSILVANSIYNALQTIHKNLHATKACVLSVCTMNSTMENNNIAEKTTMNGHIRAFSADTLNCVMRRMREIVKHIGMTFKADCKICFKQTYLPNSNNSSLCKIARKAAADLQYPIHEITPAMGSDDFSFYLEKIPGIYMTFGISTGEDFPVAHSNRFNFNEKILTIAVAQLAKCVTLSQSDFYSQRFLD